MKKLLFFTIVLFSFLRCSAPVEERDYTKYVLPLMGSDSEFKLSNGNVYPCIARPWGMNHWTPQTAENGERWQYSYDAYHITGIKQTHQPSPWVGDYGMFSLMPTVGVPVFEENDRKSWFSHKAETVLPHYYSVYLADYDVTAELTPASRAAMMQFTFPEGEESNVVVDAFAKASGIKVIPEDNMVVGYSTYTYGYDEKVPANFRNYFVISFDKKFSSSKLWKDGSFLVSGNDAEGSRTGAVLTFNTEKGEKVTARIASSFISEEQALLNLRSEVGDKSFDELLAESRDEWNSHLGRFRVLDNKADDLDNLRLFYTSLYRILLYPREFHEYAEDGSIRHFSPYNGKIESGRMYTDNGFWDTFRAVHPFFNLFYPQQSSYIMEGLANTYKEGGWLPEWASPGYLADAMIGSNSTSLVASAYLSGVPDMDMEILWDAVYKSAYNAHPEYLSIGRSGIDEYLKYGYVPNDIGLKENAARTLEYCYADYCMYALAKALGKDESIVEEFARRSTYYTNLFDSTRGLMVGRDSKGEFRKDYCPYAWGGDFTEGTGQQYTWSVFHDPKGLENLMGGRNAFIRALDTVFTTPPVFDESAYGAVIHEIREMQVAGFGQYAHGNQPIQHMIYLYDWAAQPWKAQYWTRRVMDKLYKPAPDGYCGDEDNGQTSAWFAFSAMGFYPVCPVTGEFAIGSPLFRDLEITMPNGKIMKIRAKDNSRENVFIQKMTVDGKSHNDNYLCFDKLSDAPEIVFEMGSEPEKTRGTLEENLPYSFSNETPAKYEAVHDEFSDVGQYNIPEQRMGTSYWVLSPTEAIGEDALAQNLVAESIVGLTSLAVNDSRGDVMVWMDVNGNTAATYDRIRSALPMKNLGTRDLWSLLQEESVRKVIDGYVLYDLNNHESVNAASTAAHVYNGIMVDRRYEEKVKSLGYRCLFDASGMSLEDSWKQFRGECSNNALVLMPACTSNQRSTAIAFRLFTVNLNKVSYKPEHGNNKDLILDVLKWLEPLSPVFGWEQAVGEDSFVGLVGATGNFMVPYDWTVNTPLMSAAYKSRQSGLVKVTDPTMINYGDAEHYMSFYMSDGDNVQWMINSFDTPDYYASDKISKTKMTFGYPVANMSMVCPAQNAWLLGRQNAESTLMESLGGGYYYADEFASLKDRKTILEKASRHVTAHMRQHRNKILALVCMDVDSEEAKEAYSAFVRANDELEGIVVIQYTPYAGGDGEIFWFENTKGVHIPVITVRYSIWNYGEGHNGESEGTPAYIASKYNGLAAGSSVKTFSVTSVHAWSSFTKITGDDPTGETVAGGDIRGVGAAELCQDRLDGRIKVVNAEELVWQLRMYTFPEETKKVLESYR